MTDREQVQHFETELNRLVERFRKEYQISYAGLIGALTMKAVLMTVEANEEDEE